MHTFNINPVRLIRGLSQALELVVDGINTHHWRVAAVCQHISGVMNLPPAEKRPLFMAALLHDIGAASDFNERRRLLDLAPSREHHRGVFAHAEDGFRLLKACAAFRHLAETILHHHDHWAGGNPTGAAGETIPLAARVIHLADSLDIKIVKKKNIFRQRGDLVAFFQDRAGRDYDPAAVEAFVQAAQKDCFWLDMENAGYADYFFHEMESWGLASYQARDMLNIAEVFAKIIDRTSSFTAHHSRGVSKVATLLAGQCGFCESELEVMEKAGLLLDLGKLTIPNGILEKPGPLTPGETEVMRRHTYYTYRILRQVEAAEMETAAEWAAFHHETLDGLGYPFRLDARKLSLGSRIMTVADIFVALAEDRPYRGRLERPGVEKIMRDMAGGNKIDPRLVRMLFDVYPQADEIILRAASRERSWRRVSEQ
jgi:HD-GYP domain-containing protein (c-di-GMP phosphodiesterase class II)